MEELKKIDVKKRKIIISLLCDPIILKKFDKISDETNIPRTKLLEASMIKTINEYKNGNNEIIEIAKKLKKGYKEFQKEEEP